MIRFLENFFSGIASIFMLHRVYPHEPGKLLPNEDMKISPEFLENFILELKSKRYEFISLDRLHDILTNGEYVKKQIIFTLDDGYKDNYEVAYPIFKKYTVPFTIYLSSSFPERKAMLWWYILEDILISNNEIKLGNGQKYKIKTEEEKIRAFYDIRSYIISLDRRKKKDALEMLFRHYDVNWEKKCEELCMSWDQIQKISKDPICSIGGHTKNHLALNKISEEEIMEEVLEDKELIELKISKKVEHFAYPFGSKNEINRKQIDFIKSLGVFKTAVTTLKGNVYKYHKNHMMELPRIMLREKKDCFI